MKKWLVGILLVIVFFLGFTMLENKTDWNKKQQESKDNQEQLADDANTENTATLQETEETEPTEEAPLVETVTLTATGDCTFAATQIHPYSESFYEYYDNYGPDYFFENVRPIFEQDDFTLINLECALTNSEDRVDKEFILKGKPEYVAIMTGSSIEGCTMGNNHTRDLGESGFEETKQVVSDAGIGYACYKKTEMYTTPEGKKIGYVSVSLWYEGCENEQILHDGIVSLREQGADIVIAACHWGVERTYYPIDYQQNMAHNCIDWGADVVIACHPHVLQGMEVYNGKVICYSLGNFCFGGNGNPSDKDTLIYQQTFTFVDGVLQQDLNAHIIPCRLSGHDGYNDYQPVIATGEQKATIIQNMNEYSKNYSNLTFDEDGNLILNNETTGENSHE